MRIDALTLRDFRNYREQAVSFGESCNVIYGENAEGKTNLLEAIEYLAGGKSPRARRDAELIRFGAETARLEGRVFVRERNYQIQMELRRGRRKSVAVNGVTRRKSGEADPGFHTVFFCPDDLYLIRDGAAARRRFFDTALTQLRPRYGAALSAYNRAYEQKTRILRDCDERPDLLAALPDFNERLVSAGAALIRYRAQYAQRLREYAAASHAECSGGKETLDLFYETVSTVSDPLGEESEIADCLRAHLETHREAELRTRLCLSGPHKDDLAVRINGQDARQYASQGQARTAALALKLAEREILKNTVGEYPVLLLDDVLSELDPRRQEYVLNRIAGGQVFITCCEDDRLAQLLGGRVFHVRAGTIG